MNTLGKLMGVAIAVAGLVSFGVSTLYSYAITKFDYYDVMTVFFIISAVMMILAAVMSFSYKKINDVPEAKEART
jgi:EamA domain-containing membrane protein RarD